MAEVYVEKKKNPSAAGETFDISEGGISFIVPVIRLGEHYLVSDGTVLELKIELPGGELNLTATGCRYEQIDIESSVSRFLVGAKILWMGEKDKVLFREYLESSKRNGKDQVKNVQWGLDLTRP